MTERASQHKQVKQRMIERYLFDGVENRTHRIGYSSRNQPHQPFERQIVNQRFDEEHDQPPHRYVHRRRNDIEPSGEEQFQDYPGQRQSPGDPEYHPADRPLQGYERERSICPGYEDVNRRMIDDFQPPPKVRFPGSVVSGGSCEQDDHAASEDSEADDVPGVASQARESHHQRRSRDSEQRSQSVGDDVNHLLGGGVTRYGVIVFQMISFRILHFF